MTTAEAPAPPQLETISIDVDGDIGTLTLNRPKVLNAMSPELIGELVTAAGWLADRAALRGLIVTGAGRAFSAGGDVTWFKRGLEESGEYLSADVRHGNGAGRARQLLELLDVFRIRGSADAQAHQHGPLTCARSLEHFS